MVTHAYGLDKKINMVVHTVGPSAKVPGQSDAQEDLQLYSAIYNSLLKADEYKAKSVSIPPVSAGIFAFPIEKATAFYFRAIFQFFADHPNTSIINVRLISNEKDKIVELNKQFDKLFPN